MQWYHDTPILRLDNVIVQQYNYPVVIGLPLRCVLSVLCHALCLPGISLSHVNSLLYTFISNCKKLLTWNLIEGRKCWSTGHYSKQFNHTDSCCTGEIIICANWKLSRQLYASGMILITWSTTQVSRIPCISPNISLCFPGGSAHTL